MYLKHLTINGFKSFAKKGELEFSAPITAIVGPNGSGKSNVAESFRFVLGEQSVKGMRAKRGADLIFNGTDKAARSNRASVQVVLDNTQKVFPVDFDEITVERVVHRDGQNEYRINGSQVRLKDVQELLAAANIGPSGHHIISQGEADRILSSSARERREMIEDAMGLKVYQFKKQEAEKKLTKTRENIERVESLRREVAPHLKYLERQIKKIERAVQLRQELSDFYLAYLRREDVYLAHQYDTLTKQRREPAQLLEAVQQKLAAAKQALAEAEQDQKRDELIAAEQQLSNARQSRQAALKAVGVVEGQIDFLKQRIARAEQKATERQGAPVPFNRVSQIVATVEQLVDKAVSASDVSVLQRALEDVRHTLKHFLHDASEKPDDRMAEDQAELAALESQKQETEQVLIAATTTEEQAQAVYDTVRSAIEAEMSESRAAERAVFELVNELRECESKLQQIDAELRVVERDRDEFKRELQEAVALLGRAASQYIDYALVENGQPVTPTQVVAEDRSVQRERRRELEKMKIRLEELGGVDSDVEREYKEVKERDEFLAKEIADLTDSVAKLEELIADLTEQLNERFVSGIEKISVEFNRFFTLMFGGGQATLERVKPKVRRTKMDDELGEEVSEEIEDETAQEGIELAVKLPNKRVQGLDMLSGGERALTSIALIFAMSQVNPPLFIILDETDAALDEANSRRYGDMIEALAQKSQLILITHNRETMSRAGILYGVTMAGDGVSKLLSVKLDEAMAVAK
jgi:chromosome segregation protein